MPFIYCQQQTTKILRTKRRPCSLSSLKPWQLPWCDNTATLISPCLSPESWFHITHVLVCSWTSCWSKPSNHNQEAGSELITGCAPGRHCVQPEPSSSLACLTLLDSVICSCVHNIFPQWHVMTAKPVGFEIISPIICGILIKIKWQPTFKNAVYMKSVLKPTIIVKNSRFYTHSSNRALSKPSLSTMQWDHVQIKVEYDCMLCICQSIYFKFFSI